VVRAWQSDNERPFFYAGPRKGAEVAAWKQAARAELAQTSKHLEYVNVMLDMIKAFERVSHEWLAIQGAKFEYPLAVLRLSIQAYRLGRTVVVDGVCSALIFASRGITAGSVHATVELRLLIIDCMTQASYVLHIVITLYVDDASLEAIGPLEVVKKAVVAAVGIFIQGMRKVGMDFSATKNCCVASTPQLAAQVVGRLPDLGIKIQRVAKSLGGAVTGGKHRNAKVQQARLAAFKTRKDQFQKLRRSIGATATCAVLRSGGTAALVYGGANMGVANTTLAKQRSAVAASSVRGGAGEI